MTPQLEQHRAAFKEHLRKFFVEGGPSEDPEYGGTLVDWCWDWLLAHPAPTVKYRLFIQEGPHWLPVHKQGTWIPLECDTLEAAKAEALKHVDDALPRNIVVVMGYEGHAYFGGDGGSYWQEPQP